MFITKKNDKALKLTLIVAAGAGGSLQRAQFQRSWSFRLRLSLVAVVHSATTDSKTPDEPTLSFAL